MRIIYSCKKCGWSDSINAAWGDISPKKCMGARCGVSFIKEPNMLEVKKPEQYLSTIVKDEQKSKSKKVDKE